MCIITLLFWNKETYSLFPNVSPARPPRSIYLEQYMSCWRSHLTVQFLPGQWLDVFTSPEHRPGGFTITSTPAEAKPDQSQPRRENAIHDPRHDGYLELAIQKSPNNPPAAWLWRTPEEIVGKPLFVRVGGSFVWPPQAVDLKKIDRIVFVGGGVGIKWEKTPTRSVNQLIAFYHCVAL